jgi:hypothetical protein
MRELTIKDKFNSLTKKQQKIIDNEEYSCSDDLHSHIEMMYDFNHLTKEEKRKMLEVKL